MSFREKILSTAIVAGMLPYLIYFGFVFWELIHGQGVTGLTMAGLVSAMVIGMIIMIVGSAIVAIANRTDGEMHPDEREKAIERRGIAFSYHLLCVGVILTIGLAWWGWATVVVIHLLAFVFIVAELARMIVELHGLRRGY